MEHFLEEIYNMHMSFVISKSETKDQKLPCHRHRISLLSKLKFVFIKLIKVQNLPKTFEIVPPLLFQAKIIKSSVPILFYTTLSTNNVLLHNILIPYGERSYFCS